MELSKTIYSTALYMRLSREDDDIKESSSISTQKKMLEAYANENNLIIYDEYIDDGFSGTNFERPAFKRMIQDIENKKVNLIITKDLSRLGRDYITTGQYTEIYFPEHSVRYIAINDAYDSDNEYNDIAPFKNVINEMYARDTSKKIKTAFKARMKDGKYIANFAPYGYTKAEDNKNRLVPDPIASVVVKDIFAMAKKGLRPIDIVRELESNNIMSPAVYKCTINSKLNVDTYTKHKQWTSATITKILKNIVYLGHTAQGKSSKINFKSKVTVQTPKAEWIIVENTHEPLVDQDTFDKVAQYRVTRTNKRTRNFKNIFSGIARCADCGRAMSSTGTRKKGAVANLVCGGYKLYGTKACTNHFIDYDTLYNIVLSELKKQINLSSSEKNDIVKIISKEFEVNSSDNNETVNSQRHLQKLNNRMTELDHIIKRIYEDNIIGKISDERFSKLLKDYENEQKSIKSMIDRFNVSNERVKEERKAYINFFKLVEEVANVDKLTPDLLYKLIEKIEIGQGVYVKTEQGKIKQQTVIIYYRFIGNIEENRYSIY
ncbi:recombinase family protein [Sedimentibacter sp. zth1]|uniref:recombinase family protein n=1 Tax=Sedimentibacter sp. zth1 TaxID=2816908 RepID=UPI001A938761|nr:recombinase family protein [Sedimentibacter sp. zth1]QSX05944.1 recombinase family protein [Sedimentibacter sp. zth1]